MPAAFPILFGAALTVGACAAAGKLLFRALGVKFARGEDALLAFVTGSACWSALMFALSAAGLVRRGIVLSAALAAIAAALRWGRRGPAPRFAPLSTGWRWLFRSVFAAFAVFYFFNAMAPETSPDGSSYHLAFVAQYLRSHGFVRIPTSMYAQLSQGLEMLFLSAFAFGRHSAASLVHFSFLLALPLAMLSYGRRFGFPRAGAAAGLLVFVSPVAGVAGTAAYNDVAVACVLFGMFYLLEIWNQERHPGLLAAAGLLAGLAYAIKYTAFVAVPFAIGYAGWKLWRARKPVVRPLAVLAGCSLLLIVPWIARNSIVVGNPFAPFFNRAFPNPYLHISTIEEYSGIMRHYQGLSSYWAIPIEVTLRGGVLQGLLGPVFLLAPLALLALRHPAGRRLLLAWVVFSLTYFANVGTRFLLPGLPFLAMALGLGVRTAPGVLPALVLAHALFSWPAVLGSFCDQYAWRLTRMPEHAALRRSPEERYLRDQLYGYPVARMVEEQTPPDAKVFTFSQIPNSYTSREILVAYEAALNNVISDILNIPVMHEQQPLWRMECRFAPQALRRLRLVETADDGAQWAVNELRIFCGGRELPRAPAWRLRASPNPWDVQMAFDNSLVTRWRSWQPMSRGMYLEIDFGDPQAVDAIAVECSPDQAPARLRVDAEAQPGQWKTLSDRFTKVDVPYPQGLRRAASEELKARGIDYLLESDSDFLANDFRTYRRAWGLRTLGSVHGNTLYRIE